MDLAAIKGTGPRGRVTAIDIEEFLAAGGVATATAAPAAAGVAAPAGVAGVGFTDVPIPVDKQVTLRAPTWPLIQLDLLPSVRMQGYAATVQLSKQTIPHYYVTIDLNLEELLAVRAELNANLSEDEQISVNDFFIKASALAMKSVPEMNSSFMDSFTRQYHSVNTAVTVGDGKPLRTISSCPLYLPWTH